MLYVTAKHPNLLSKASTRIYNLGQRDQQWQQAWPLYRLKTYVFTWHFSNFCICNFREVVLKCAYSWKGTEEKFEIWEPETFETSFYWPVSTTILLL